MVVYQNANWARLAVVWPALAIASKRLLVGVAESLADVETDFQPADVQAIVLLTGLLTPKRKGPERTVNPGRN